MSEERLVGATLAVYRWVKDHYHSTLIGKCWDATDDEEAMQFSAWFAETMEKISKGVE